MHHVPHTGDLPNTVRAGFGVRSLMRQVMTTARSSVLISPHNFLLSDPSRASRQQIRIDYNDDDGVTEVHTFGQARRPSTVSVPALDYYALKINDVAVRKFPYEPLSPYNDTTSIVRRGAADWPDV